MPAMSFEEFVGGGEVAPPVKGEAATTKSAALTPIDHTASFEDFLGEPPASPSFDYKGLLGHVSRYLSQGLGPTDMKNSAEDFAGFNMTPGMKKQLGVVEPPSISDLVVGGIKGGMQFAGGTAQAILEGIGGIVGSMTNTAPHKLAGWRAGSAAVAGQLKGLGEDLSGQEQATLAQTKSKQVVEAINNINLAPDNTAQEAASAFANILPNGFTLAGELGFRGVKKGLEEMGTDQYHAAIGGALAEGTVISLATILMMKPKTAAKILKPIEAVGRKPEPLVKIEPTIADLGNKISTAFDALAAKEPSIAADIITHVEAADPALAKILKPKVRVVDGKWVATGEVVERSREAPTVELPPLEEEVAKGTAAESTTGFTEAFALGKNGATADLRNKMWEAYDQGKSTVVGVRDPVVAAALQTGTKLDRPAFDTFVEKFTAPDKVAAEARAEAAGQAHVDAQMQGPETHAMGDVVDAADRFRGAPTKDLALGAMKQALEAKTAADIKDPNLRRWAMRQEAEAAKEQALAERSKQPPTYEVVPQNRGGFAVYEQDWQGNSKPLAHFKDKAAAEQFKQQTEWTANKGRMPNQRPAPGDTAAKIEHAKTLWGDLAEKLHNETELLDLQSKGTTAHAFLDAAIKASDHPYVSGLLSAFRSVVDDVKIEHREFDKYSKLSQYKNSAGIYQRFPDNSHRIVLNTKTPAMERSIAYHVQTVVHELGHAVTTKFMTDFPTHVFTKEIKHLFAVAKSRAAAMDAVAYTRHPVEHARAGGHFQSAKRYGLTDIHEFIAETLSNADFQRWLIDSEDYAKHPGTIPLKQTGGIASKLVSILQKILGIKEPGQIQLLNQIFLSTGKIMEAQRMVHGRDVAKVSHGLAATLHDVHAMAARPEPGPNGKIEKAFAIGARAADSIPGVAVTKGEMRAWYDYAIRQVNPEALGPKAKLAAALTSKEIFYQAMSDAQHWEAAKVRRQFWNMNAKGAELFIDWYEKGAKFKDPILEKARQAYNNWNAEIFDNERKLGYKYEPVDNYLYHIFERPEELARHMEQKYGPKWKDPGFIKDRTFDLYAEARRAGYKPKFSNPEDIMLARQHASSIAEMQVNLLAALEEHGLAVEGKAGDRPGADFPATMRRSPTGKTYWVHNDAYQVLHNAFDSHSLWSDTTPKGKLFRGAMAIKNTIVPVRLALSLFHPLHVQTIHNATNMVRATNALLSGKSNAFKWMTDMAAAGIHSDIYSAPKAGNKILRAFRGELPEAEWTATERTAIQYMAEGGMLPEQSAQYRTKAQQRYRDALDKHSPTLIYKAPLKVFDSLQGVIFREWIPALKVSSYLADVKVALEADPSLTNDSAKRALAFRRLAKSVDNRYGEMAYSTLFWDRTIKDLAVVNTLSLGWNLGFLREYGGGAMDLGQFTAKGGKVQKIKEGQLSKPLFMMYYTVQGAMYSALMTKILGGKDPDEWMDYVNPVVGKNPDGSWKRVTTMFYAREFLSLYKHIKDQGLVSGITHLVVNKSSDVIGLTRETLSGSNDLGQEFRNPSVGLLEKTEQTIAFVLGDVQPISIQKDVELKKQFPFIGLKPGSTMKDLGLAIAGFTPAPAYMAKSDTAAAISNYWQEYRAPKATPFEVADYSKESRKLKQARAAGDMDTFSNTLQEMREKYKLTPTEVQRLRTNARSKLTPEMRMFTSFPWQEQQRLLDAMTEDERREYLPHSNTQHLRHKYRPPEERR